MVATTEQLTAERIRIEPNPKWVRGRLGARTIVDSRSSRLVWEIPYYPAWYFPIEDVHAELRPSGDLDRSPRRGDATRYDLVLDPLVLDGADLEKGVEGVVPNAAWRHLDSPVDELRDLVRIEWGALDTWLEEDVEVFIHPRDPYSRVDALASSRRVRVIVDGAVVADSVHPTVLFETGLPARYYVPVEDVRMDLLTPTDHRTGCPYKGFARYWNVEVEGEVHENLVWSYPEPLPEAAPVAGLLCFYSEKVDLEVDGQFLERPHSPFS